MLLDLEAAGQEVYYSEPMLRQPEGLNDAYLHRSVRPRYFWIRSPGIGPLPPADLGLAAAGRLTGGARVQV